MKISYNWLKWYVDGELPAPEKLADVFTFKLCEVEGIETLADGDTVFDLNILPNRAHDLLSHQGIGREVAGLLGFKFKDPTLLYKIPESKPTNLKIDIQTDKCRRYMGRIVRNIKVGPSPEWVVKHLESVGQRSINNIVDATNLVMLDCGQPTHAFDAKLITNEQLRITNAKEGEEFPVLGRDQIVAKLKETDVIIADTNGKTLAIAGVKGGLTSGVTETTTEIVLEVANFNPVSVRKTARRLNLLSDSAKRFENDLSPEYAAYAMRELSATILEMLTSPEVLTEGYTGPVFEEIVDVYPVKQETHSISFSILKINKMLGTAISEDEMVAMLTNYGYEITGSGDARTLSVSALRLDLTGEHDVSEEVARLYGLDAIPVTKLETGKQPATNETLAKMMAVREKLINEGYREVMTYAFRKKGVFEVARGVGDKGALRTNITDGLKESYELNRLNAPLLGLDETKIFEIGAVWPKEGEVIHVAMADKKSVVEMTLDEYITSYQLPATSYQGIKAESSQLKAHSFAPWSNFPFITRDVAVWAPQEIESSQVFNVIKKHCNKLVVKGPTLFDQFTKDGRTSYAFRLIFQSFDKTLSDVEVEPIMNAIVKSLTEQGFEVR